MRKLTTEERIRITNELQTMGYTTHEELGAWRNGTRVEKTNSEPGDGNPDGTLGTILGSISAPDDPRLFYFVRWDSMPQIAVGVLGTKIKPVVPH